MSCGLYDPDRLNNCLLGTASSRGSAGFPDFDFDKSMTGDLACSKGSRNKLLNTDYEGELHGPATLQVGRYRSIMLQVVVAPAVFLLANDFSEGRLAAHVARSVTGPFWEFASGSTKAKLEDPGLVSARVRKVLVACLNFDAERGAAIALLQKCQAVLSRELADAKAKEANLKRKKAEGVEPGGGASSPLRRLAKVLRTGPARVEQISVLSSSTTGGTGADSNPKKKPVQSKKLRKGTTQIRKKRAAAHSKSKVRVRITRLAKKRLGMRRIKLG